MLDLFFRLSSLMDLIIEGYKRKLFIILNISEKLNRLSLNTVYIIAVSWLTFSEIF